MHVVIFGASGMIGSGAVLEALDDPEVTSVRTVGRTPLGLSHPKLTEVLHGDFLDLSPVEDQLAGLDACLWCLGISSSGLSEADYRRITVDFTRVCAATLLRLNPGLAMCFVSGAGADRQGRAMWARVKAEAEDVLLGMGFSRAVMFRPAMIRPMRGVTSKTTSYRTMYALMTPLWPVLRAVAGRMVTDSATVGRALLEAAKHGAGGRSVLENHEINGLVD